MTKRLLIFSILAFRFSMPLCAAEPSLARLSFWLPPDQVDEFETTYQQKLLPILKDHGLVESSQPARATVDSVFTRLFEFDSPSEVVAMHRILIDDKKWAEQLEELPLKATWRGRRRFSFGHYATPAGPGKVVEAGPGNVVPAGRGRGQWRTYDAADGLATAEVRTVIQDSRGHLWFGTWGGGVSRYDGQTFTTYTNNDVLWRGSFFSIVEDRDGNVWIPDGRRLSRYDGQSWTHITNEALTEGVSGTYLAYVDRDGHLWLATFEGVMRYDPSAAAESAWTSFTKDDVGGTVNAIFQDRDGHFWFGLNGRYVGNEPGSVGVSRYDGHTWETFSTEDGLAENSVIAILEDRDGNFWFGTRAGVTVYDGQTWKTLTTKDGLADNRIEAIFQDHQGDLWFGAFGGGVSRLTRSAELGEDVWITYSTEDGLADNRVFSICQDREGHLWFGTDGGVSRYSGRTFTTFTTAEGLPSNRTYSALRDRDRDLWFATAQGLTRYDGQTFTTYDSEDGLGGDPVHKIFQDVSGDLWMTTRGLSRYDGRTFTTYTDEDGLGAPMLRGGSPIHQDRHGHLWFGLWSNGGLSRFDGRTFVTFSVEDGLAHPFGQTILEDRRNTLWVGTAAGLHQYVPDPDPDQVAFTSIAPLSGKQVWTSLEDRDGNLWFGTWGDGVARYDGRDFTMFDTESGLAHNVVLSIIQDRRGHLWFGTDGGLVSRYDGQVFQTLTREDGLTGQSVRGMYADNNGDIWMMTLNGIVRYREPEPYPPGVFVDAVVADRRYEDPSDIAISSDVTLTAFEFHGLSLKTRPGAIVFRYRLTGYHDDWRNTYQQRVEYQDLPSSDYTFEVVAVDRDLVYSDAPAVVALTVHLPYERYGLWSGLGIAIVLIAWQSARVIRRDRRLQQSNAALSAANNELFQVNVDLQREQVLERLRGQAQGMQSSEDIQPVAQAVYQELTGLGLPLLTSAIVIHISEMEMEGWAIGEDGRVQDPFMIRSGPRRDTGFHDHLEGSEATDRIRNLTEGGNPRWRDVPEDQWPRQFEWYNVAFEGGHISMASEATVSDEHLSLIKRFGEVFGYAHSRYVELQEKEAQNRALQNQNTLERLRGQAQGMQSSEDIGPVVEAVHRELTGTGLPLLYLSIWTNPTESGVEVWTVSEDGRALPLHLGAPPGPRREEARRRGDDYLHMRMEGEEARRSLRAMAERGNPAMVSLSEERWPEAWNFYCVFFENGAINLAVNEPAPEDHLMLIKRFGEVFGFAHSRWEELKLKEAQNRRLVVEASVQRLRAEVQAMDEASDFERILSLVTKDLDELGLGFASVEIDLLNEPAESPSMEHFERDGFCYTTFTLAPDGKVETESYDLFAPFPAVNRETIERFVEGEPWQGRSGDRSILEVAAGSYGRLRMHTTEQEEFTDDEIATVREFANAIALGYARYLDIREIQTQTQRKSAFLASMSHELRTPMNAIKGFTNMVLRRAGDVLPDRQKENLRKVNQASDHLLAMINDLLDLSKIEAGRMDVNVETFNVGLLIASCCDTVSPLIREGVELEQEVAEDIGEANTDRARVQQMVINLLSNAIKFTESGTVVVTAQREQGEVRSEKENLRMTTSADPDHGSRTTDNGSSAIDLVISVSDTGKGIPAEELPTLFDEYRQVRGESESEIQAGTGLGLSITKKFAELLGGSIGVESEIGKGSTFTITIPSTYSA